MSFVYHKEELNGETYHNFYSNEEVNSTITVAGTVHTIKVNPKIVLRQNNNIFGDEIIIQGLIKDKLNSYETTTPHETIEIYFKNNTGINFLKWVLNKIEEIQNEQ